MWSGEDVKFFHGAGTLISHMLPLQKLKIDTSWCLLHKKIGTLSVNRSSPTEDHGPNKNLIFFTQLLSASHVGCVGVVPPMMTARMPKKKGFRLAVGILEGFSFRQKSQGIELRLLAWWVHILCKYKLQKLKVRLLSFWTQGTMVDGTPKWIGFRWYWRRFRSFPKN